MTSLVLPNSNSTTTDNKDGKKQGMRQALGRMLHNNTTDVDFNGAGYTQLAYRLEMFLTCGTWNNIKWPLPN